MSTESDINLSKLQCTFPKLTEANQQLVEGIIIGLKYAQTKVEDFQMLKIPLLVESANNENEAGK
jgi:hypothetical protein